MITIAEVLQDQLKGKGRGSTGNKSKSQQHLSSQSKEDLLAFLNGQHSSENDCLVCIVIHNIDGPALRDPESQQYLARIACCSHVRMVASIDHVNAPLCKFPLSNFHSSYSSLHFIELRINYLFVQSFLKPDTS